MIKKGMRTGGLVLLSIIFCLSLFFLVNGKEKVIDIPRNRYGEGDKTYHLEVMKGEDWQEVQIVVPQLEPDEEDWSRIQAEMMDFLKETFLNELAKLTPDSPLMDLPDQYGDCTITWKSLTRPAVDDDGYVWFSLLENNTLRFEVIVSLGDYQDTYHLQGDVSYKEERKEFAETLQLQVKEQTGDCIVLPTSWEGESVVFYQTSHSWLGIPAILSGSLLLWQMYLQEFFKRRKEKRREQQIQKEFPLFLSKLILYLRAGMNVRKAFLYMIEKMEVHPEKSQLLQEMILTRNQIYSGMGEGRAYEEFGNRCKTYSYKRVGMLLGQAVEKSGDTLLVSLENELEHYYLEEKNLARKKGEESGTKLLLPTGIQFVLLMVTMMLPAILLFQN